MPDTFGPQSNIRDVLEKLGGRGQELLRKYGYEVGEGYVDVLSQYQTLETAARQDRIRQLDRLLGELNAATP